MKVAVIGAGPAGLAAAIELARNDTPVTVFERHERPGAKIRCAEGLFDLHRYHDRQPEGTRVGVSEVLVKIHNLYSFAVDETPAYILDKEVWLAHLAREAESEGANLETGSRVEISEARKEYDYVLDCSGSPSQSSSEYGIGPGSTALAVQVKVGADFGSLLGKMYVQFVPGEKGYRWIFPKSEREANVGIGWTEDPPRDKWGRLGEFCRETLQKYEPGERVAGQVPISPVEVPFYGNILLCGDAAGLANPYHGGGIHNALFSGTLAAKCLAQRTPDAYPALLSAGISAEMKVAAFARGLLERSPLLHEKAVAYLSKRFTIGQLFSPSGYRRLIPFIHTWNLGTRLVPAGI